MRAYYFLFILQVAIIPLASAEVKTIGIGNDVFIGEQGIDISACVGTATSLAWFAAGTVPATDVPDYVLTVGDPANFAVAPSIFVGRTGHWYRWTGSPGEVAFNVLDPSIDVKVWDQKTVKDVSGKSVPAGDFLNFRIESNLYTISQRPNYNAATDGQFTIKVKTADGFVYNALYQTTSTSISLLKVNVAQQPAYWVTPNNDNTIGWNTGVLDSQGTRMYKAGVYTVTAECNVNGIKDNYKAPDGSDYIGKTVSAARTVTITPYTFKPSDSIAPGDIIPVTVPSIVPVQPDIIAPGDIIPVTVPSIVPVQPDIIAPGDIIPVTVPDIAPPGASDEDQGRAASFRAALEANGFIVNSGQMTPVDPIVDLLDSGFGDSANGNNAGQPYKVLMVPISPLGEENPFERGLTIFRLRPDEAVVYLGPTPPQCDYFSFTVFLWVRHKDSLVPKGDWMVAAVNDPLNSALIKTEGNGTPFRKQTMVIFTADRGVYERVAALAQEAGYPESMINPYVIPSGLLNLGVLPDTPLADSFIILMRTANFVSKAEGDHYLSDDHYARVWRVTPEPAPALDPFPTPDLRVRKWKSESELYPDLNNGLERLENAILAQTPHVGYESYESIRWFAESREVLEETDPGSPLYHKFVAGEASDTPYLRTSLNGEAANFTLGNDDMVVVYGVNHAATGLATYSNFGVYGDWVTSSCQDNPWQYVFGCGDRSWNGVVSMTNHAFTGSAEEYIPGDPMAPYLYAVKVLRQPPQDKHDKYFVVVPTATPEHPCASPGYCLGLNDPIIIGYRAYLNPATASGADYDDIIHDRAIRFSLRD